MPLEERIDRVLSWLAEGPDKRPHFVTLYIDRVDALGHLHGPASAQARQAMQEVDVALTRLLDGLTRLGLRDATNLVVVSDHGMADLVSGHEIVLEDIVDPTWVDVVSLSEIASFNVEEEHRLNAGTALLSSHEGMRCYRRAELPQRWRYGSHPRVPEIICQLEEGWRIRRRESFNPWQKLVVNRGAHGFDPDLRSMRALFVAHGPAFRCGLVVEPFHNVHVYPLLTRLLGIAANASDGDPSVTAPMLRPAPPEPSSRHQKSVQP